MKNEEVNEFNVEEYETNSLTEVKKRKTVRLVGTAIFAALSVLLYIAKVPPFVFPLFPGPFSFLEINFSEVPALIAGFAYGPLSGFIVILIRFLVKLPLSTTMMIGEIADIFYSSSFVVTAALIYKYKRTIKGVFLGLGVAFFIQVLVSGLANYLVIYDLYNNVFFSGHIPFEVGEFIKFVIPFNIIKNLIIATITLLVYKKISRFISSLF